MKAMLDRLKGADPDTYQRAFGWLKNVAWILIQDAPEKYFLDDGPYPLRDALLQGVLQEAIQAHRSADFLNDWFWKIEYLDCDIYEATVYRRTGYISKERHDSPVAALLTAYLSAIEEQA